MTEEETEPLEEPQEPPRGGRPVWTGQWWRDPWHRQPPRPVPFTGRWIETESDEAADQWDPLLWRR